MISQKTLPILYPTHFNKYAQCPERYHREYQLKQKRPQEFSRSLARGIAVHEILALAADEYRTVGGVPANLYQLAKVRLPRSSYADESSWNDDVQSVVQAAKIGISYLDGASKVLDFESTLHFSYRAAGGELAFTLAAKTDLILLKRRDDGSEFLDVVDYKSTATIRMDPIQDLASRITVKNNARARFGVAELPIVNTTVLLGAGSTVSRELTDDECRETWTSMTTIAKAILQGDQYPPAPSPLCTWCPFFENGCSMHTGRASDQQLSDWLDGAAD